MKQILFVLLLIVALNVLGMWGLNLLQPPDSLGDFLKNLYMIAQLFTFGGEWTLDLEYVPIQLEITRFLAPAVTVFSFILVFVQGAWESLNSRFLSSRGNHILIVGLNELGWHFAQSCQLSKRKAIVIELDDENRFIPLCRQLGVPVVVGDALDRKTLLRAGILKATNLVTFMQADGRNVELSLQTKRLLKKMLPAREESIRIHLHLKNTQLATHLGEHLKHLSQTDWVHPCTS